MMDTVLNLGMNDETEAALATECGDPAFARDTHRRFLDLYARIVLKAGEIELAPTADPARWRDAIAAARASTFRSKPRDSSAPRCAPCSKSWNSRRARRYRQHHDIPDDLGTAVTMQAMVFGNLDDALRHRRPVFAQSPDRRALRPTASILPRAQGEDVVSGKFTPRALSALAAKLPEFTRSCLRRRASSSAPAATCRTSSSPSNAAASTSSNRARPSLLRMRPLRIAVDLVREGLLDEAAAISAHHARAGSDSA